MTAIKRTLPFSSLLLLTSSLLFTNTVFAHVRWALDSVTPPRTNDTGLKSEPCGGVARTNRSTIFTAGQTIELEFEETIDHPGHYRIAFSPANDLNFDSYVLVDNIPDVTNTGRYVQEVTIPMEICSACTLQLIQVMTTSTTPLPNDFYYSCSDIEITAPGDTTQPLPVSGLTAQVGNSQAQINWTNPVNDFYQVVVLKNSNPIVDAPHNGATYNAGDTINSSEIIYVGSNSSITVTNLINDNPYYFKLFSQNPRKNYAAGVEIMATPTVSDGGDTGTEPGNPSSPDDSGGGSMNFIFLALLLLIRTLRARQNTF